MAITTEDIQTIADTVRAEFIAELERHGLVLFPKSLASERLEDIALQKKQKQAWKKTALEFREIADAELWGPIDVQAVRAYAQKYAKKDEIFPANKGNLKRYKIIRAAVIRLAKKKGYAPDHLPELQN